MSVAAGIAHVALDVPLAREFDYLAGDATPADIGQRVAVPFGNKVVVGILTGWSEGSTVPLARLKAVQAVFRETPALPLDHLQFLRFCAGYYHHPLGQVLLQALPPALRRPLPWQPRRSRAKPASRSSATAMASALDLQPAQQAAIEALQPALSTPSYQPVLLRGVTGSGKTEVYLALAAAALARGRSALLLVPEIHLTPQLLARIEARFPDQEVLALHSQLAGVARVQAWLRAQAPGPRLVVGTRLAILCPLGDLGLVVVDEEHDASYKQQEGLRYSARDLAVVRARQAGCPVVLGSATPSLETLAQVARARYLRLELPARADRRARLPDIELIDSRAWPSQEGLSAPALQALRDTLQRGEQSLVFINRRGFSPALWCSQCGWLPGCPQCSSKLVLHLRSRHTRCHLCGLQQAVPRHCPDCGNADLRPAGEGTQRLEAHLRTLLPQARVVRVDADSMAGKQDFAALREAMLERRIDIAVGTQMLSKGHDFPALTCVVVVNADGALFSADFRAEERLLAQLLQVAGRAGRAGLPGRVLIQTAQPEHPLFQAVRRHDFDAHAARLLSERAAIGFPPATHQAVLHASAVRAEAAEAFLQQARLRCPAHPEVQLFEVVPALVARIANRYRFQLLLQSSRRGALQACLSAWIGALRDLPSGGVLWVLDVDPQTV